MMVREARARDARQIHDLYQDVMQYDFPVEQMEKMIEIVYRDNNNYVFVAVENEKIQGVIEVVIKYSIHKEPYLIINTLAVALDAQRKGVGTKLLAYVETFAKVHQLGSINVGSQFKRKNAHRFYQKNGFDLIKEHKIFEKKLPTYRRE